MRLSSRGWKRDGLVVWLLEGNQFEFTEVEFAELVESLTGDGLFEILKRDRPALADQIKNIFPEAASDPAEFEKLEFALEQRLLDLSMSL